MHKPEHMTQLDAGHFAPKTDPRIKLRGRLDTLHALVMLVSSQARRGLPHLAGLLDTLAAYCREIQSAEYNNRPVSPLQLGGKTAEEIHAISHHPERHLGIAHIVPGPEDLTILHWLNYLRATAREIEIAALEVYPPPEREDLVTALNRLSSAVYYLELLLRAGIIHWNS
jgi:ethanolamine utilization cobalamin adenosyltransferase